MRTESILFFQLVALSSIACSELLATSLSRTVFVMSLCQFNRARPKYLHFFLSSSSWDRENLQKLPQLAAIHHNNCMYIAHHLLTMGHQFRYRLTNILCDGAATFVDLVPGFRRLGNFTFQCWSASMGDLVVNTSVCCWMNYSVATDSHSQLLFMSFGQGSLGREVWWSSWLWAIQLYRSGQFKQGSPYSVRIPRADCYPVRCCGTQIFGVLLLTDPPVTFFRLFFGNKCWDKLLLV